MNPEMLKGHLEPMILAAVENSAAHGYAIIDEIRRRTGGAFDLPEGTIYPALHRLEGAGLLQSEWTTVAGARKRRIYSLTPQGGTALGERKASWGRFAAAVDGILGTAR